MQQAGEENDRDRRLPPMRVVDEVRERSRERTHPEYHAIVLHDRGPCFGEDLEIAADDVRSGQELVEPLLWRVLLQPADALRNGALERRSRLDQGHSLGAGR